MVDFKRKGINSVWTPAGEINLQEMSDPIAPLKMGGDAYSFDRRNPTDVMGGAVANMYDLNAYAQPLIPQNMAVLQEGDNGLTSIIAKDAMGNMPTESNLGTSLSNPVLNPNINTIPLLMNTQDIPVQQYQPIESTYQAPNLQQPEMRPNPYMPLVSQYQDQYNQIAETPLMTQQQLLGNALMSQLQNWQQAYRPTAREEAGKNMMMGMPIEAMMAESQNASRADMSNAELYAQKQRQQEQIALQQQQMKQHSIGQQLQNVQRQQEQAMQNAGYFDQNQMKSQDEYMKLQRQVANDTATHAEKAQSTAYKQQQDAINTNLKERGLAISASKGDKPHWSSIQKDEEGNAFVVNMDDPTEIMEIGKKMSVSGAKGKGEKSIFDEYEGGVKVVKDSVLKTLSTKPEIAKDGSVVNGLNKESYSKIASLLEKNGVDESALSAEWNIAFTEYEKSLQGNAKTQPKTEAKPTEDKQRKVLESLVKSSQNNPSSEQRNIMNKAQGAIAASGMNPSMRNSNTGNIATNPAFNNFAQQLQNMPTQSEVDSLIAPNQQLEQLYGLK